MDTNLIYNNMNLHYSALIKADCIGFGSDDISISIFNELDEDSSGYLDEQECLDSASSLGGILKKAINNFSDLCEKYFGKNYSEQLDKYNTANKNDLNEEATVKVLKQNLSDAKIKIKQYASLHPDNEKINAIAKAVDLIDFKIENKQTWYVAITYTDENLIRFSACELENINPSELMKNLIHEMGHYINGDTLSSIAEEIDVESQAINVTEDIEKIKLYENKDEYMEDFANRYRFSTIRPGNYGETSPGYNGLPLNSGFVINEPILSVENDGNQTIINVSGNKTYRITWSDETDEQGNPYPESVMSSRPFEDSEYEGLNEFNISYRDYNKKTKTWENQIWADRDKYKKD